MSYESDVLRDWYLLFHYGSPEQIVEGTAFSIEDLPAGCLEFPTATVRPFSGTEHGRALDIGCAVGRSSFALSLIADEVIGIDFSHSFVDVAEQVRNGEEVTYRRYSEMHLSDELHAEVPPGNAERIRFEQGDAMNLRSDIGSFDLVHAANLLCRLPEPTRFLHRLPELVNPGGQFVISTPATWMSEYTPKENQPDGLTLEFLKRHLSDHFELDSVTEIPFLIREHQRKLQLSTAQTSLWVRK